MPMPSHSYWQCQNQDKRTAYAYYAKATRIRIPLQCLMLWDQENMIPQTNYMQSGKSTWILYRTEPYSYRLWSKSVKLSPLARKKIKEDVSDQSSSKLNMHVYSIRVCLNEEKLHEGGTRFQKSHTSATCSGFPPVQVTPCWRMPYLWVESHEESIWWYICGWMVLVALHASLNFKNKLMKRQVRATPFQWCVVSLKQTNSHANNHLLPWLQSTLQWYAPSTSFWYWEKRPFNYEIRWCDCW